jgi:hypothetical protein
VKGASRSTTGVGAVVVVLCGMVAVGDDASVKRGGVLKRDAKRGSDECRSELV